MNDQHAAEKRFGINIALHDAGVIDRIIRSITAADHDNEMDLPGSLQATVDLAGMHCS